MVIAQQILVLTAALIMLGTVRRSSRSGRLSFGSAVLWSAIGGLALVGGILIPFVGRVGSAIGLLPAAVLAASASLVLGLITYTLSLRTSDLERVQQDIAEHIALRNVHPAVAEAVTGSTLVVIPALNEARSVAEVVTGLIGVGLPVLVVDDGSNDATASVARTAGASVMMLPTNLGVGGALRAGFRHALARGYEQVIQCDADGQHPLAAVQLLLSAQRSDPVDLLVGSRFVATGSGRGEPFVRAVAMRMLARLVSRAAGAAITDATSGLRVIRSPLLEEVARWMPRHYLGDTFEMNIAAARAGYSIREHPVEMLPRAFGSSSASPIAALRLTIRALLVSVLRAHAPITERQAA